MRKVLDNIINDFEDFKVLYADVPFSTFTAHLITYFFVKILLIMVYAPIAGIMFFVFSLAWERLTESNLAITNSPYRFPFFILGALILWRIWPLMRIFIDLSAEALKALCQLILTIVLTAVFIFFLFTNPLGLLLFIFLFTR